MTPMPREIRRRWPIVLKRALLVLLAIPLFYGAAGLIGGAIPTNREWQPPARDGVTIFVETNGIHTGIVVPVVAAGVDWGQLVRPEHLADPRYARTHLAFGWGERDFYLNTPTWGDLTLRSVLRSAFGSDTTLMHVDHLGPPVASDDSRPVVISAAEYRRLAALIRARFVLDAAGQAQPIRGYGPGDVFYVGRGHYDALRTCNA